MANLLWILRVVVPQTHALFQLYWNRTRFYRVSGLAYYWRLLVQVRHRATPCIASFRFNNENILYSLVVSYELHICPKDKPFNTQISRCVHTSNYSGNQSLIAIPAANCNVTCTVINYFHLMQHNIDISGSLCYKHCNMQIVETGLYNPKVILKTDGRKLVS